MEAALAVAHAGQTVAPLECLPVAHAVAHVDALAVAHVGQAVLVLVGAVLAVAAHVADVGCLVLILVASGAHVVLGMLALVVAALAAAHVGLAVCCLAGVEFVGLAVLAGVFLSAPSMRTNLRRHTPGSAYINYIRPRIACTRTT